MGLLRGRMLDFPKVCAPEDVCRRPSKRVARTTIYRQNRRKATARPAPPMPPPMTSNTACTNSQPTARASP